MERQIAQLDTEQIKSLVQAGVIPKDTPPAQIAIFARVCAEANLSPFSKDIHLVGYAGKYSIITSINGFRKIASRTGLHAGTSDVKFDLQPNGQFKTAAQYNEGEKPKTATVTVTKFVHGTLAEFTHTAVFKEFAGSGMWGKMPFQMIGKVAEAFALRKAFGDAMADLFVEEEIDAIRNVSNKTEVQRELLTPQSDKWQQALNWLASMENDAAIEKGLASLQKKYEVSETHLVLLETESKTLCRKKDA